MLMLNWLKLSHHHHSGQLRTHEHTSYAALGILLLLVGISLSVYTAGAASPGPQAGSVGLTGVMPGKPPTTAATISQPSNGQHFGTSPVTVSGTCPKNTLVEIFKNDIFAGSTTCSDKGTYSLEIDLLIGQNILIARVYDALNQPGPDSAAVTIYYDALPTQASPINNLDFGGAQLLLNTDAVFRGIFPGKEMSMPIDIIGGTPPYALNIKWGDASNSVIPRGDNQTFNATHVYKKAGVFQVTIQATDAVGRVAFLTVASIVNGQPAVDVPVSNTQKAAGTLLALWPLYAAAVAAVISFYLGERREKQVLLHRGLLVHP